MTRVRSFLAALVLATLAALACSDVTDIERLEIASGGVLVGQAFLDLDGSGSLTTPDSALDAIRVQVLTSAGGVVADATTDSLGFFIIEDVPVGSYRLTLDPAVLADSLEVLDTLGSITVSPGDTASYSLGATFPILSLEAALNAPVGQRIFTSGIALNSRINFGDGQVHFKGASDYLRALDVARSSIQPGDSVRVRGRVVSDNGRPALRDVTPFILVQQAALVLPVDITVPQAADADGGTLDAALARIRAAEITDTSTNVNGHFRFWAVNGPDSVEVVIRSFLSYNTSLIRPDTIIRIDRLTGLLSPLQDGAGQVRWRILPRAASDIFTQVKTADVAVSVSADTTQASLGDIIEFRVVAENSGPLTATGARIRDTIPSVFAFVSATATVGSYDDAGGVWDIGDLLTGSSDTLWLRMELTDDAPASVTNLAQSLGLTLEVDPIAANNSASVTIIIN